MSRPYDKLMKDAECNKYALAEEIYQLGRADKDKELSELPNQYSEKLWKNAHNRGYEKGRADYEAECQKIFEDNPPMHFNHEQIMWLKEFVKIRCNQARADAINNFVINAITEFQKFDKEHGYPTLGDISVILSDVAEQLKEQNKK